MENHTTQEFLSPSPLRGEGRGEVAVIFQPSLKGCFLEIQVYLAAWFMRRFLEYVRSLNQRRAPVNNFFLCEFRWGGALSGVASGEARCRAARHAVENLVL